MFRNMVTSLFKYGSIQTTDPKAKELRRWADQLITLAKRGDLHARRQAMAIIREKNVVHKLFNDAPERFGDKAGGYTRLVKVGIRKGDAAVLSMVELTGEPVESPKEDKKKAAKPGKKAAKSEKKTVKTEEKEKAPETEE